MTMETFLIVGLASSFWFVTAYFISSFINEVILRRSGNPKLYIASAFIFLFMLFILSSAFSRFAARDANVFVSSVMGLGIAMIFSIAYLMQQKYRAKIGDEVRFLIGMFVASVLVFIFSGFTGTPLSNWSGSISEPWAISPAKHIIETGLIVAVWMWTFIGLKSKYWRAFVGYLFLNFSILCIGWVSALIAARISTDPLFLMETTFKTAYL